MRIKSFEVSTDSHAVEFAVCPGGEGAVLKTVGLKRLARSNRVHGVEERVTSFRASMVH